MKSFFKEAMGSMMTSGTVKPSSKHLIANCLKGLDVSHADAILEFGTGDGCITQELCSKMGRNTQLISFEVNPKFYNYSKEKFAKQKHVQVVNHSAFDFNEVLEKNGIAQVDYIISSLPLSLFKQSETEVLFEKIRKYLKPGGKFIQYQYSIGKYWRLKKTFKDVRVGMTLRNLPPALVFRCKN